MQVVLGTKHTGPSKHGCPMGDHSSFGASGQDRGILNRCDSVCTCVNAELVCPCALVETGPTLLGQKDKGHPSSPPTSSYSLSVATLSSAASRLAVVIHEGGLQSPILLT